MHLTRFADNGLRCLMFLALHPGETSTVREIASGMARPYGGGRRDNGGGADDCQQAQMGRVHS